MEQTSQAAKPIVKPGLSEILTSTLGRQALKLFGRDNMRLRQRSREIARLINTEQDAMVVAAHFDQLVPAVGLSSLDNILFKLMKVAPSIARGLPFLSKRLDHIERVAEIALIFDVTRLRYIRDALENYHGDYK